MEIKENKQSTKSVYDNKSFESSQVEQHKKGKCKALLPISHQLWEIKEINSDYKFNSIALSRTGNSNQCFCTRQLGTVSHKRKRTLNDDNWDFTRDMLATWQSSSRSYVIQIEQVSWVQVSAVQASACETKKQADERITRKHYFFHRVNGKYCRLL